MKRLVTIYGLYAINGACRYVGATINPIKRRYEHLKAYPKLRLEPIKHLPKSKAELFEISKIEAYKKIGQCDLNKAIVGRSERCGIGSSEGRMTVKIDSEIYSAIKKAQKRFPLDYSIARIANYALKVGLAKIKP